MGQIWVTSDWHFCHDRGFLYEPRGFSSVWENNQEIISRYNEVVKPDDDVYVLGDLMLNNNDAGIAAIKQLKGWLHIIRGNHDSGTRMDLYNQCYNVIEITEGQFLKYNNYHFYLSHFPTLVGNYDDRGLKKGFINLCGHRHDRNKFCDMDKGLIYHVEVDAHNCYPVLIDNIIQDLQFFISLDKYAQEELCKIHI